MLTVLIKHNRKKLGWIQNEKKVTFLFTFWLFICLFTAIWSSFCRLGITQHLQTFQNYQENKKTKFVFILKWCHVLECLSFAQE